MRGISREVLKSLVDFMYLGETSFSQHGMDDFLKCAKELEVKNLVNEDESIQENSDKIINEIQKEVGNLFSCKYCDLKMSRKSSLIKHLATTHSKFTEAKELIDEIRGKGNPKNKSVSEILNEIEVNVLNPESITEEKQEMKNDGVVLLSPLECSFLINYIETSNILKTNRQCICKASFSNFI